MSIQPAGPFSCSIDLVGTRELARENTHAYWQALSRFQELVADLYHDLDGSIYIFSDSAFIQAANFANLAQFLCALRHELLVEGLYFKGAIGPGQLKAKSATELELVKEAPERVEGEGNADRKGKLFGHYFGEQAAELVAAQEVLKGIGLVVSPEITTEVSGGTTAYTCYLPQLNSLRAQPYLDLLLDQPDLSDEILDRLLRNFFKAKSRSKKYGRFYIPLLVLWVQSLELPSIDQPPPAEGNIISILASGNFEKLFGDVAGIENIVLCLLNRLYLNRTKVPLDLFYEVRRYVLSRRRMSRSLDSIPQEILSLSARASFLEDLSSDLLRKSPEDAQAKELILQLVSEGLKNKDIAEEMTRRRYPSRSGRPWNSAAVSAVRRKYQI